MPPNTDSSGVTILEEETAKELEYKNQKIEDEEDHKHHGYFLTEIIWSDVSAILFLHVVAVYTILTFPFSEKIGMAFYGWAYGIGNGFGITILVHRCITHKSFKVKKSLKIFLMILFSMTGQYSVFTWVRDHRIHHKYCDTLADPYNARRGFFYSHCGWLMMKRHPEMIKKSRQIDMSDVKNDPVLMWFNRHHTILNLMLCFVIPIAIPCVFFGESIMLSLAVNITRYCLSLNGIWVINSLSHKFGPRPYDKSITPTNNWFASFWTSGEGWHNYHHTFPWDYKASERGYWNINTMFIDIFAKMGLAYDFKEPSPELLKKVIQRCGDGSHSWGLEVPESEELNILKEEKGL